jgi:ubiquinone/menaquinone biosynthesis C-methylase UbiE
VSSYEDIQTKQFMSHEDEHHVWVRGQYHAVDKLFRDVPPESRVLDVGCGDGLGLEHLERKGFGALTGIDLSEEKMARAATRALARVLKADAHALPFSDGEFDVVYASHSLEHCHTPERALSEFRRVLVPGGRLFIVVPYPDTGDLVCHCGSDALGTRAPKHGTPDEVAAFFTSRGFVLSEVPSLSSYREPEIWLRLIRS